MMGLDRDIDDNSDALFSFLFFRVGLILGLWLLVNCEIVWFGFGHGEVCVLLRNQRGL